MLFENFFASLIGKRIAKKLDLQEGPMEAKKWYQSKTIWGGIYATVRALYTVVGEVLFPALGHAPLPPVPPMLDGIVGSAVGGVIVYGRVTANSTIGS